MWFNSFYVKRLWKLHRFYGNFPSKLFMKLTFSCNLWVIIWGIRPRRFQWWMSSPPAHAWCVEMFYLMMQSVSSSGHKNYSGRMLETHLKLHSAPVHLSHTFLLTISNNLELSNAWDKKQTWIFFYLLIYSNGLSPVWMKHSKLLKNK